jgi:hypothetical protein
MSDMSEMNISDFIEALASDPNKEYLFGQEPVAVMNEFGLSADQQRLLLKGSIDEIRTVVQEEPGNSDASIIVIKIKMK